MRIAAANIHSAWGRPDEGAEIDLARVGEERQNFDPVGHYSRSDVFELRVDRRRLSIADLGDEPVSLD